jgi:hypothetical protein
MCDFYHDNLNSIKAKYKSQDMKYVQASKRIIMGHKNKSMDIENVLKGRMAETLVEELLRQSKNVVYRFGYEAIVQNLIQLDNNYDRKNETGDRIGAMPDFIVIDKKGNPVFVEVKFRWKPELHEDDYEKLKKINNLWSAKIIFVNCSEWPYFRVSDPPYIDENHNLILRPLLEETVWEIDEKLYNKCEELVFKYLTSTSIANSRDFENNVSLALKE